MQPVCTAISTLCHAGRGLAGHPRCVNVGNDYGKTRFAQICSKTIVLPRCARHHSAQRECSSPPRRGDESAGKSSHRNRSSSPERVRLLQPLHPRPQKIRRPILDLRLLNYALMKRSFRVITLKQIFTKICPVDWFMSLDLKDVYFRIQVIQESMRSAFEVVAYQYKVLPFGLSLAPHIFTRCMDVALSPLRKMGIRILNYLDDWLILAQLQAVLTSHKTLLLSHLDCLGLRVNFAKSMLSPSQRVSFLGTAIDSERRNHDNSAPRSLLQGRSRRSLKAFQRMLGLMAAASPILQLDLLHMRPNQFWLKQRAPSAAWRHGRHRVTVTRACVSALARWRDPFWLKRGMILDTVHRRKVVMTDVANKGWGALCEGKLTFALWS